MMTATTRRILIVDDDRAMVRTLSDVLQLAGWETDSVSSGEAAVGQVTDSRYAAVLMDVRMGGMSGVEALRAIRSRWPTLPVVLMTAYASAVMLDEAVASGAARVLHKPVPIPELFDTLASVVMSRGALLVVDDDPDFRRSLTMLLSTRGYSVRQAASLVSALASLRESAPAVVVLDLMLGDVDPSELLDSVRRANTDAAIILCTGHPQLLEPMVTNGLPARVLGCLIKPFSPDRLTCLIDAAIT
jgi:DNA-binding NtrC family response regulator